MVPCLLDQVAVYSGFRIMDEDGDGELSKQELIDHLTNYGERMSGTFRLTFHHFDRFELDLRRHIHVRGAAFSCLRLKLADIVLI